MRIAIIDLGTNSVRFDVQQLGPGRRVKCLHREKIMVRLGQGIFLSSKLDPDAIQRTLQAFHRFRRLSDQYRVSKTIAFGTSALREASDREGFLATIKEETGIHVRVISGAEEAKLIALGIQARERIPKGLYSLVDIGGGSTEISVCQGEKILHSASFPIGTARLQQLFLSRTPPKPADLVALRKHVRNALLDTLLPEHWPRTERIIGSSGTIRALDKILGEFTRKNLSAMVKRMSLMTTGELLGIPGMESKRVDMILAGAVLFEECMAAMGAKKATSSEFSLRDGILEEELALFRQGGGASRLELHIPEMYEKARLLGGDVDHLQAVVALAEELFKRLQPVHRLNPSWKIYLVAACILRDTGEAVNLARHHVHSYYIIKHSDLPAMDNWELEFISQLCLHHEGAKLDSKDLSFTRNKVRKDAFRKLLALLRVVDELDTGPDARATIKSVKIMRKLVRLRFTGRNLTGMEAQNVAKKGLFFEKVFGRALEPQES